MTDIEPRVNRAALLACEGNRDAPVAEYEGILAAIDSGAPYYPVGQLHRAMADLLLGQGDPRETRHLTLAVAAFQRQEDLPRLIDACLRLAALNKHSATVALYWVDRAISAARLGTDPQALGNALASRGELLLGFDRVDDAFEALSEATALPGGFPRRTRGTVPTAPPSKCVI